MNGIILRVLPAFVFLALVFLTTCGKDNPTKPEPPTPVAPVATRIVITPSSAMLNAIGQTIQLTAMVFDQNSAQMSGAAVIWISSDLSIATVSAEGLVMAVRNGTARITATSGSATVGIDVTVMQSAGSIVIAPDDGDSDVARRDGTADGHGAG